MAAGFFPALILSFAFGESHSFAAFSKTSILALAYLVVFGSVIAFTAYSWLSRNIDTQLVSTYALVNPVVAVILGSLISHEPVSTLFFAAIVLIGIGLALLIRPQRNRHESNSTPKRI
jgi:drug/metabolite transporter (DMT)-like permease